MQVPNPETQRGHRTLSSGTLAEKAHVPGCSRTFLSFPEQQEAVSLHLCPADPDEGLPVEAKGPFHWPFPSPHLTSCCDLGTSCPSTGGTRMSAGPPPPQATCRPYPWHSVRYSEGKNGKCPSLPFSLQPKPSGKCLPTLCVWVTMEGKETSEESGILGSNPSSDICFLDGPGEL